MGKLIIKNNGYTTEIVNGIPFSAITAETNTNYLGFNPFTNGLESLNPNGSVVIFDNSGDKITQGTYNDNTGTLTLTYLTGGTLTVTGFTTGSTVYEVGSGSSSVQLVGVSGSAIGDYSVVSGGFNNTTFGDRSSIVGGSNNLITGTTGVVNSTYNGTYSGSTFSGYYGSYSPSSTLSGLGTGATFSFYFNPPGTLSNIYVNNVGNNYINNDTVTVLGNVFGGTIGTDNVTFQIGTVNSPSNSFIGGGLNNTISSYYGCSVIVGGQNNRTYDGYNSTESNFIGGGCCNTSSGYFSTVVAGRGNCSFGNCTFVGGGCGNRAYSRSTIGGGRRNTAGISGGVNSVNILGSYTGTGVSQGTYSVYTNNIVSSGIGLSLLVTFNLSGVVTNTVVVNSGTLYNNSNQVIVPGDFFAGGSSPLNDIIYEITGTFTNSYASIIGGRGNKSIGGYSTVSGGYDNTASGYVSTISGGYRNTSSGYNSTVVGGCQNTSSGSYTTVGGGRQNTSSGSYSSTISGGKSNTSSGSYSTIGGGSFNNNSTFGSVISGGISNLTGPTGVISTLSSYTSGAGLGLADATYGPYSQTTTSGNGVGADFTFDVSGNTITGVTISNGGFGYGNGDTIFITGTTFPGGTSSNDVTLTINNVLVSTYNTIGGGRLNISSSCYATIGGGRQNTSSSGYSTISGGYCNTITGSTSGILGGCNNKIIHDCSFIVGSGICSTAANTTHVNCLHFSNIPTSASGLAPGTVWSNGGILNIA